MDRLSPFKVGSLTLARPCSPPEEASSKAVVGPQALGGVQTPQSMDGGRPRRGGRRKGTLNKTMAPTLQIVLRALQQGDKSAEEIAEILYPISRSNQPADAASSARTCIQRLRKRWGRDIRLVHLGYGTYAYHLETSNG